MIPFTLTTVADLQPGDTFYKYNDDATEPCVYTVLDRKCSIQGKRYVRKGSIMMTDIINKKLEVVFLKHKTP